jgi:hypothetical protein
MRFGHVLIAVRQGRQRRNTFEAGEEKQGFVLEGTLMHQHLIETEKLKDMVDYAHWRSPIAN